MRLISAKRIQLNEFILFFVFLFELLYFLFDPIFWLIGDNIHKILRLFGLLIVVLSIIKKVYIDKKLILSLIIISIASIAVVNNGSPFGVVTQLIWPFSIIIFLGYSTPTSDFFKMISAVSKIFILLLTIKTVIFYKDIVYDSFLDNGGRQVNPNSTALILAYLYWFATLDDNNEKYNVISIKELLWALIVCTGIIKCGSRASLIAVTITILMKLFLSEVISKRRVLALSLVLGVLSVGISFPFFYINLFKNRNVQDATIMGKEVFTGREWIWMNLFNYFDNNPICYIFGTGYNDSFYKKGSFNLHNAYLMLMAQYGVIVLVLYLSLFISIFFTMFKRKTISIFKLRMFFVVLITFIVGIGETTFSYIPMLIFPAIALAVCNNRKVDEINAYSKENPLLLVR